MSSLSFLGEYPIVDNRLYIPVLVRAATYAYTNTNNSPQYRILQGLVDTGATQTALNQIIARKLNLADVSGGRELVAVADGRRLAVQAHYVEIIFNGENNQQMLCPVKRVKSMPMTDQIIIGMDILSTIRMDWDGLNNRVQIFIKS